MAALAEIRLEEINAKEDLSLRLGDALDVKASIGLALLLFLATQSAYFFDKGLAYWGHCIQIASILCISAAIVLAICELWPRQFILPEPESPVINRRIQQLRQHFKNFPMEHPDVEASVKNALIEDELRWTIERIADNQKKNKTKSDYLNWSFWLTIPAIAMNLLTVFALVK
jgi:hypothetical protein